MLRSMTCALALALGLLALAPDASAQGQATLDKYTNRGQFQVQTMSVSGFTLFLPVGRPAGSPILTWGNGTGASPNTYSGLLNQWASYGIIVVASTSSSTGTGSQMVQGIGVAQGSSVGGGNTVCTSGHSQGGSGAVNAARDSRVDCAMPIELDNTFTATSNGADLSGKPSLILCGTSDSLAPCGSATSTRNGNEIFNQSAGPVVIAFRQGATHFTPTGSGTNAFTGISTAWLVGNMFGNADARALFFGPSPQLVGLSGWVNLRFKGTSGL